MSTRREFITLLGGAAAAWPIAAYAQQRPRVPIIGFLGSDMPSSDSQYVAAFGQRLRALGWIEGRDVAVKYRWGEGRVDRFAELAEPSSCGLRWALFSRMKRDGGRGKTGDVRAMPMRLSTQLGSWMS